MTHLRDASRIYFVGIKGVAMTALAIYFLESGKSIRGCDTGEQFPTDDTLLKSGISIDPGFDPACIDSFRPDVVIYTGAHQGIENPVVQKALTQGIPVLPQGKALGIVMEGKRQISVSGSHGKTTTSAMIAAIFSFAGYGPSYAVGCGGIPGMGAAGHAGTGEWFIAEADEYVTDPTHDLTPRFLWQNPEILVVTNIDYDHPDVYPSIDTVVDAFLELRNKLTPQGLLVYGSDDLHASRLVWLNSHTMSVGENPHGDAVVTDIQYKEGYTNFHLTVQGDDAGQLSLSIPGRHNVINAAMSAVVAHSAGISWDIVRTALSQFHGTMRRFEHIGTHQSIQFYDDYAHHPNEIAATIAGVKAWYPNHRIVVVFQPHTVSRTLALLLDFVHVLAVADVAIVTEIYASAREPQPDETVHMKLYNELAAAGLSAHYAPNKDSVQRVLHSICIPGDIVLFMGAGNIYLWGREIVQTFTKQEEIHG